MIQNISKDQLLAVSPTLGDTPFHAICRESSPRAVLLAMDRLQGRLAEVISLPDSEGNTILHLVARYQDTACVLRVLSEVPDPQAFVRKTNNRGATVLEVIAINAADMEKLHGQRYSGLVGSKALIACLDAFGPGAKEILMSPNKLSTSGLTPFHSIARGHDGVALKKAIAVLGDAGVQQASRTPNSDDYIPLGLMLHNPFGLHGSDSLQSLLKALGPMAAEECGRVHPNGATPLYVLCWNPTEKWSDLDLKLVLDTLGPNLKKACTSIVAEYNLTPLHLILANESNKTGKTEYGKGSWRISGFRLLLDAMGPELVQQVCILQNAVNGYTPLHGAVLFYDMPTITLLLEYLGDQAGIIAELQTKTGETVYDVAQYNRHAGVTPTSVRGIVNNSNVLAQIAEQKRKQRLEQQREEREAQDYVDRQEQRAREEQDRKERKEREIREIAAAKAEIQRAKAAAEEVTPPSAPGSWQIDYGTLKQGNKIGQGAFGVVYRGEYLHTDVAIKELMSTQYSDKALQELRDEAAMLAVSQSAFLVRFYGVASAGKKHALVMEYVPNGSLFGYLQDAKRNPSWPERLQIASDISKGLDFLHHHNIEHRDLKSLNILLDDRYRAKITDFGLARIKTETASATQADGRAAGTVRWMAPECFMRKAMRGKPTDVYALGMVFWEIASRLIPYADEPNNEIVRGFIKDGELEDIPEDCHKGLAALILQCWQKDPAERPTAGKIVAELAVLNDQGLFTAEVAGDSAPNYQGNLLSSSGAAAEELTDTGPRYQENVLSS